MPTARLRIAAADGFCPAFGRARREALRAIKGLAETELPLFAAANPDNTRREVIERPVMLQPMAAGREVVEDYSHTGLSLRRHPVAFLREDLTRRRIVSCAEAMSLCDRR